MQFCMECGNSELRLRWFGTGGTSPLLGNSHRKFGVETVSYLSTFDGRGKFFGISVRFCYFLFEYEWRRLQPIFRTLRHAVKVDKNPKQLLNLLWEFEKFCLILPLRDFLFVLVNRVFSQSWLKWSKRIQSKLGTFQRRSDCAGSRILSWKDSKEHNITQGDREDFTQSLQTLIWVPFIEEHRFPSWEVANTSSTFFLSMKYFSRKGFLVVCDAFTE